MNEAMTIKKTFGGDRKCKSVYSYVNLDRPHLCMKIDLLDGNWSVTHSMSIPEDLEHAGRVIECFNATFDEVIAVMEN